MKLACSSANVGYLPLSLKCEKIDYDVLLTVIVLTQIVLPQHCAENARARLFSSDLSQTEEAQKRRVCRFDREELLSCAKLIRICAGEKRGRRVLGGIHGTGVSGIIGLRNKSRRSQGFFLLCSTRESYENEGSFRTICVQKSCCDTLNWRDFLLNFLLDWVHRGRHWSSETGRGLYPLAISETRRRLLFVLQKLLRNFSKKQKEV